MTIPLIKFFKKTTSKIEQAKVVLSIFCLLSNIKLSDAELTVMAYFLVYKIKESTKELILKSQVLKSADSLSNAISKLRGKGLIKKTDDTQEDYISNDISFEPEPVLGMIIKVDNN